MVHLSVNENAMAPMANAIAIETEPEQLHSQHVRVNWHKSNSFLSLFSPFLLLLLFNGKPVSIKS